MSSPAQPSDLKEPTRLNPLNKLESSSQPSQDKPDKAKAILAGALQVFTTQGYAAASMDRIASAAGVSKPTLYRYFQDKEGLFIALTRELTQKRSRAILKLLSEPNFQIPPDKVLHQIATVILGEFSQNQQLMTLMRLIIGESERFPELAQTFVREIKKPILERLACYLESQPQLKLPDPMVAARIFVGSLVHYLLVQNIMHGSEILPLERDRLVNGLIHLMTDADKTQL
ncbi:MAG: TetR/AcrR family transcriptional regulator [Microcoleus sp.]|uniref:TetR/AcrR family transcriptional regulator n=1 Tax=Microcoleus sp. TaxID=44472 RepID=UPI003C785502